MKKDKQKIIGEDLTDERLKQLLELQPEDGINPDYFILMRAYRALRSHDFSRFLPFFQEAGLNLQAKGPDGFSLVEEIAQHQQGEEYLKALQTALS